MRELFVYYRIAAADAARCEALVRGLQARLMHEIPGLRARLLARPSTGDAERTWMETYALDAEGGPSTVDASLEQRIDAEAAVLAPYLRGPRHVEVFVSRW